jgi:glutaredoxin-like protein NrdH
MTTVYTKPNCVQCNMTKRHMDKIGVKYRTVDITEDKEALNKLIELGYKSAPVVMTEGGQTWSGFQPAKIDELAF